MSLTNLLRHQRNLIIGSIGILVIVLGLVALISQKEPSALVGTGEHNSNGLPAQAIMPTFEVVQINQNGSAIFSGSAAPGATIRLNLNGTTFSTVRADIRGDWIYIYGDSLARGKYVMSLNASLQGFADTQTDEQLLIDLVQIDSSVENALANSSAVVFAVNSQRGLRVLQRPGGINTGGINTGGINTGGINTGGAEINENNAIALLDEIIPNEPKLIQELPIVSPKDVASDAPTNAPKDSTDDALATLIKDKLQQSANYARISIESMGLTSNAETIIITGTGEPNAEMLVSINNGKQTLTKVSAQGLFEARITPDSIAQKNQLVRIDQRVNGGIVDTSQAILQPINSDQKQTLSRSTDSTAADTDNTSLPTTKVRKGESLWALSVRVYGNGSKYKKIFEANRDQLKKENSTLQPGMVLKIPK